MFDNATFVGQDDTLKLASGAALRWATRTRSDAVAGTRRGGPWLRGNSVTVDELIQNLQVFKKAFGGELVACVQAGDGGEIYSIAVNYSDDANAVSVVLKCQ